MNVPVNVYRSTVILHVTPSGAVRDGKRPPDGARSRPYLAGNPPKTGGRPRGVLVAPKTPRGTPPDGWRAPDAGEG
jgi:hypothetical protein